MSSASQTTSPEHCSTYRSSSEPAKSQQVNMSGDDSCNAIRLRPSALRRTGRDEKEPCASPRPRATQLRCARLYAVPANVSLPGVSVPRVRAPGDGQVPSLADRSFTAASISSTELLRVAMEHLHAAGAGYPFRRKRRRRRRGAGGSASGARQFFFPAACLPRLRRGIAAARGRDTGLTGLKLAGNRRGVHGRRG